MFDPCITHQFKPLRAKAFRGFFMGCRAGSVPARVALPVSA